MFVRGYQAIEAGEYQQRFRTARKIAFALNCTVDELFPVYGVPKPKARKVCF